jgi:uncharacterized cupin superfamily protein
MSTTEHLHSSPAPLDPWFADRLLSTLGGVGDPGTTLVERRAGRRGLMAPLHARDEDETFRVIAGEVTFFVGDELVHARAGDVVVAPRGVPRTYRIDSDGARWLVLTRVASVRRFEDFGRALAPPLPTADWPSPDELRSLSALAAANGIELLGPPGTLPGRV